jgi:hypothetical protein
MIQQVKAEVGSPSLAYQMDMWSSQNSKESYACIMASVVWRNPETSLFELRQFCLEFGCFPFTRHTDDEEEDQAGTKMDCKSCVLPDEAQWIVNRQLESGLQVYYCICGMTLIYYSIYSISTVSLQFMSTAHLPYLYSIST